MNGGAVAPSSPPRNQIRKLSALLASQIAAGEVVERPASVVKELIDNALDAGATRITVELEQGGIELIRITDDGGGIPADELPLAIEAHATSKLREPEELDHIATLGFRGEALASITSVARVSIRSRTAVEHAAAQLDAEGDKVSPVKPASGPVGTSVTVRNLFFNTPARRKFLRTPATEQGRCMDIVRDLAMSHPGVGFTAIIDGRNALNLNPDQNARERMLDVLGRELATQLIEVTADPLDGALGSGRGVTLWGLAGLPGIARGTAGAQHIFVNGRPVRDRTIQHAVKEAYRGLIEPGRYPTAAIMIDLDPALVDVNVHPAKSEVRFRDSSLVHGTVLRSIREALRRADLTPAVEQNGSGGYRGGDPRAVIGPGTAEPKAFVDYFRSQAPGLANTRLDFDAAREALVTGAARTESPPRPGLESTEPILVQQPAPLASLQVHNSFLVTQDEQGLVIIDQHALHERVMFEKLLARVTGGANLESQRLLTPAVVPCTSRAMELLPDLQPLLTRIGIEAAPIGPDALAVHGFPSFLFDRGVEVAFFMSELLDRAASEGFAPGAEQALAEVLDMMSCKAAIKAGDQLAPDELADLLRLREQVERSSNCPHGRPTSIRMSIRELEKRFGRS